MKKSVKKKKSNFKKLILYSVLVAFICVLIASGWVLMDESSDINYFYYQDIAIMTFYAGMIALVISLISRLYLPLRYSIYIFAIFHGGYVISRAPEKYAPLFSNANLISLLLIFVWSFAGAFVSFYLFSFQLFKEKSFLYLSRNKKKDCPV